MITNTTRFLLPLLGYKSIIINKRFLNAYIADIDYPEWDDHLLLLYDGDETVHPGLIPLYRGTYIRFIKDNNIRRMEVFKIPNSFKKNYIHFLNGEYKKFSEDYKKIIIKYWRDNKIMKQILDINTRYDLKAETNYSNFYEYWSKPLITEEIYGF